MTGYLLDTNHLSAYLDGRVGITERVDSAIIRGNRFGICLPVLCENRAGIQISRYRQRNRARLESALAFLRLWPADDETGAHFADLYADLRKRGRMLGQFDLLIAAVARQHKLVLLTADDDFDALKGVRVRNWISSAAGT